jgi:hypothetical protein
MANNWRSIVIMVHVGELLFDFRSFSDWVNHAKDRFAACGVQRGKYILVDKRGRICVSGREMMRARDDESFPVLVYAID